MTLGMMIAVQYIIGQLNSPVEQLMQFLYSLQDVRISLERINEIHHATNENEGHEYKTSFCNESLGISLNNISFKYDSHALRNEGSDKFLHMPITSHRKQLIHIDDKNYFEALIKLNKTYADSMQLQEHQKIEVRILISDKTIGQLLGF